MTTSRIEPDADIYFDTDSGSDLEDIPDNLKNVIANKKISRFYLEDSEVSFDAIWAFQCHGEDVYYIDHNKLVNDRLTYLPNGALILHQYDIPASDEEHQKELYELYEKTKGFNKDENAFSSNEDTKPSLIAQFKYYRGYWKYTNKDNAALFHPCDKNEKHKYLNNIKNIANNTIHLTYEIVKLEDDIKQKQKYCGLSIAFAMAATSFNPSILLLATGLFLLHQYYTYRQNVSEIKKRLDCIKKSDGLFIYSVFSQQNKITDISPQINDLKKTYGNK